MNIPSEVATRHDPYAALRIRDARLFMIGNLLSNVGMRMQTVAVGWEIYERTGSAMALGWVGFVQVLPILALALPAGQFADHFSRKRIVMLSLIMIALASMGLAVNAYSFGSVRMMYFLLFLTGIARAFQQPARASLLPLIVPREHFGNAVTWNMGGFNLAAALGPALAGLIIAIFHRATPVYVLDAGAALAFFVMIAMMHGGRSVSAAATVTTKGFLAGVRFVWRSKLILSAITLDLFAVLLGGATTLLPIYAKDILHVGPSGLGWLTAMPFVGALLMSFMLAHRPPLKRAGPAMLWSVAGFGVATIVFGLSRSFALSLVMLFATGALDTISVVVRHTLVQILTPDEMRGRVSAVNGLFISASNELGGFESGLVASLFNPTIAVVSGGIGTIAVVLSIAIAFPLLRCYGRLGESAPMPELQPAPVQV